MSDHNGMAGDALERATAALLAEGGTLPPGLGAATVAAIKAPLRPTPGY